MTWQQKTIVKILLLICRMLTKEDELTKELVNLSNQITTQRD